VQKKRSQTRSREKNSKESAYQEKASVFEGLNTEGTTEKIHQEGGARKETRPQRVDLELDCQEWGSYIREGDDKNLGS